MPSTYSPLLRLELMAVGEKTNTWGVTNNTNLGTLIEKGIAGATTIDVTASDVTLTSLNGSDDQARAAILIITGTPAANRNVIAPATSKLYAVRNSSNGTTTLKGIATTGVVLAAGEYAYVGWNGADFVRFGAATGGENATGTWPISITGNAATASTAATATSVATASLTGASGEYTPSISGQVGCTASITTCQWSRSGNAVTVAGGAGMVPAFSNAAMSFLIDTPIPFTAGTGPIITVSPHLHGNAYPMAVSSPGSSIVTLSATANGTATMTAGFVFVYYIV
jgi:hypothetical protein